MNWVKSDKVKKQEYRVPIALNTGEDWLEFAKIVATVPFKVEIADSRDGHGMRLDAKSVLGMVYAHTNFRHLYCITPEPFSGKIVKFIREDDKDLDK